MGVPLSTTAFGRVALVARRIADQASKGWPRAQYQNNPVRFATEVLHITPWSKQEEILLAIRDHKKVAVCSGHKCGKSTSAAIVALWFFCSFPNARVICVAPTARQINRILWREIRRLFRDAARAGTPIDGAPRQLAHSGMRSGLREITGHTARDPDAMSGISGQHVLYVIDEASGVSDAIFAAIDGNSAGGASQLWLSNPTKNAGAFYAAFHQRKAHYRTIQVSSEHTPNVIEGREVVPGLARRDWIEAMKAEYGEDSPFYKIRAKGEFVEGEDGKVISQALLTEAQLRDCPAVGVLQVGLDPAGPGLHGDETVFCARRGLRMIEIEPHVGLTDDAIRIHLLAFLEKHRRPRETPIVALDREGPIGSSLLGLLRHHASANPGSFQIYGVRSSDKAPRRPDIYGSLRDELWASGAKWLQEGGQLLPDQKLVEELHAPEWVPVAAYGQHADKLKVTDKRTMRKALERSTDRADAFLLSVWQPQGLLLQTQLGAQPVEERGKDIAARYERSRRETDPGRVFNPYGADRRRW